MLLKTREWESTRMALVFGLSKFMACPTFWSWQLLPWIGWLENIVCSQNLDTIFKHANGRRKKFKYVFLE